jgi:antitoxin Xre/MbcA/ParS-like protein
MALHEDPKIDRCLALLHEFFPGVENAKQWLRMPNPELGGRPAIAVLRENPDALLTLLANAQNGIPR